MSNTELKGQPEVASTDWLAAWRTLSEDLYRYSVHTESCEKFNRGNYDEWDCVCGLHDVLDRYRALVAANAPGERQSEHHENQERQK